MGKLLMLAAVTVALNAFAPAVQAQSYVVNGHPATPTEAQLLASYGARPGHWALDNFSVVALDEATAPKVVRANGRGCWYDLDLPKCE